MSDQVEDVVDKPVNVLDEFFPETAEAPEQESELTEVESDSDGVTEETEVEDESKGSDDVGEEEEGDVDVDEESLVYEIDGEEITLKEIREARKGAMLHSDYTKKTQVLAEEKKGLESEMSRVTELSGKLDTLVNSLSESIATTNDEIDWEYLRDTDTSEYLKQKDLLDSKQKALIDAKAESDKIRAEELSAVIASEQTLLIESNPSWQDRAVMEADIKMMNDFIGENFTAEESAKLINHKVMNLVRDAAKYNAIKDKTTTTEKKVRKAPKAIKPSVKKTTKPQAPKSAADVFYGT